jgi:hypothetical protein
MGNRFASRRAALLGALAGCVVSWGSADAAMLYYLPFDNGSSSSLANLGTVGGTGTSVTGVSGATAPSSSQAQLAPNIGSTWSEYFPVTNPTESPNNRGGSVVLPSSSTQLRLDSSSSANQMTISSWVNWNGNSSGTITSPAGILSTMNSATTAGWAFTIQTGGTLKFQWLNASGTSLSRTTTTSVITAGQWVNVSLVFDSTSLQPVSIYVNGTAIATTGSAGASTNGVMKSDGNTVNAGVGLSTNGSGRQSLNGYQDDMAVWDTVLSAAQIKAINTAPVAINGYNAGIMNSLFAAYNGQSSATVGALTWNYSTAFNVSGRSLGDTWQGGDGKYYMWLGGNSSSALGLVAVPEPSIIGLALAGGIALLAVRRVRRNGRATA